MEIMFFCETGKPRLREERQDDGQREHGAGPPPLLCAPSRVPERARRLGPRPPRRGARLPDGAHFEPVPLGDPGHVVRGDADWNSLGVEKIEQVWRRGAGGPQAAVFAGREEHDAAAGYSGLGANAERSAPGGFCDLIFVVVVVVSVLLVFPFVLVVGWCETCLLLLFCARGVSLCAFGDGNVGGCLWLWLLLMMLTMLMLSKHASLRAVGAIGGRMRTQRSRVAGFLHARVY